MDKRGLGEINMRVAAIPGEDGWGNESNCATFVRAVIEMVESGFDVGDAIEIVAGLYDAVADEFGS